MCNIAGVKIVRQLNIKLPISDSLAIVKGMQNACNRFGAGPKSVPVGFMLDPS